ncbi:MFS transporter [uncultured Bifidobacterium sp.]|uniref:MFS transporter n=1 Tax=uncultured Bifidobacterium sp. TaxID=165187 RepID=UPI0026317B83|nr:MFS transporter [uncultured Bifidobacterium sp.]
MARGDRDGGSDQMAFLRRLFVPIYIPAILFATGEGALIPVVPLTAKALGAGLAGAGLISGLLMIGVVLGDIPSGYAVSRWGETFAMRMAAVIAIASAIACRMATNLVVLSIGVLMIGMASATFNLARHSFLTTWTPWWYRARAMSLLGGTTRVGAFIGPFIAAPVIAFSGSDNVYWIHVAACLAVLLLLRLTPDPAKALSSNLQAARSERGLRDSPSGATTTQSDSKKHVEQEKRPSIRAYLPILIRLGTAAGILQMLRASRQVILPLWGVQLNIPESRIAIIVGIAGAVDLSLFYTSGQVMDRFGRRWVAAPVLAGLSIAHLLLPLASAEWGYVTVAILLSLANGMGSGIVMTLGSDLATRYAADDTPGFLSGWRVFTDTGSAAGPLVISGMTALAGLWSAPVLMGLCGLAGAFMMMRYIPRLVGR